MKNLKNKLLLWFYSSWLGCKYLEFLLWLDYNRSKEPTIDYKEVSQIVIQAQKILYRQGIIQIKRKIKSILDAKDKKEYDAILKQITDLMPLAERESEEVKQLKTALYKVYVKKDKDIKTATDFARMVNNRISDYKELQEHVLKRQLLREIRLARQRGQLELALQKEQEFKDKYGTQNR